MIYIYNELDKITKEDYKLICEINTMYGILHKSYRNYFNSLNHEVGIYLIYMFLNSIKRLDLFSKFSYDLNGVPTIPEFFLSISRCNSGVILGIDKELIGVDIDDYQDELVLKKNIFLSDNEIKNIKNKVDYNFFINCKEAYLKSLQSGITNDIYKLDFSKYLGKDKFIYENMLFNYKKKDNYSYIICSKNKNDFKKVTYQELRRSLSEFKK